MAKRKTNPGTSSSNKKPASAQQNSSCLDLSQLLTAKNLEVVTAALLISGQLKVDSIELDRKGQVIVSLFGKFKTKDNENERTDKLATFLSENGDMTLDEIFTAFKKRMME
jgi:uncharacterized protein (DUF1501 family)